MNEEWKAISIEDGAYSDSYAVSNAGRVYSFPREGTKGGYVSTFVNGKGYPAVNLSSKEGGRKRYTVHTLIAHEFLGKCPEGMGVNHMDGAKTNNGVFNLEYTTQRGNILHAFGLGLNPTKTLPDERAMDIFRLKGQGRDNEDIANEIGVTKATVCRILNGTRRPYLKERWEKNISEGNQRHNP